MRSKTKRFLHYWLSIPATLFLLLWIVTGIAMVWDSVRGSLHAFPAQKLDGDLRRYAAEVERFLQGNDEPVQKLTLFVLANRSVAQVSTARGEILVDLTTGGVLSPLHKKYAAEILTGIAGVPLVRMDRVTSRSYEYKYGMLPAWRGEFANGRIIHISEQTGSVQSWTDRTGMMIRACYYYGHAFQFTDSKAMNAAIAIFAIVWAVISLVTGLVLYRRSRIAIAVLFACSLFAGTPLAASPPPQRIVSLAPSCTEIVAGLGLGKKLVGITSFTDYPPEVKHLPIVGSYVDPSVEAIVSLNPDLIIATTDGNPSHILKRLQQLGIALHTMELRTYEQIQQSILKLGTELGRTKEAYKLVSSMQRVANCIQDRTKGQPRPSVLFIYDSYPFVTPGNDTFTDQLIEMAGGRSITHDVTISYPRLTIETIIARDPEIVIVSSMNPNVERQEKLSWWKQYEMLTAVRLNRVYILESRNLDRPSQRIVYGFRQLAATLHPSLFSNSECSETD